MSNYYVSGCVADGDDVSTCDDSVAQFWTLYRRNEEGLSEGIIDCMFREDAEAAMRVYKERDALAALTAPPDSAPCDWVYIRFTDISKSQRMKCQIAWSDWLNSVIYDEEGAPLLISNSAFQVIRAAGYQVEGE